MVREQHPHPPLAKDIHIRFPDTSGYVILCGNRDFAEGIKLRILRWRDYLGLITRVLIRGRQRDWKILYCWLEDGSRDHDPRKAGNFQKLKKD